MKKEIKNLLVVVAILIAVTITVGSVDWWMLRQQAPANETQTNASEDIDKCCAMLCTVIDMYTAHVNAVHNGDWTDYWNSCDEECLTDGDMALWLDCHGYTEEDLEYVDQLELTEFQTNMVEAKAYKYCQDNYPEMYSLIKEYGLAF